MPAFPGAARSPPPLKPVRRPPSDGRGAGHASGRRGAGFARPLASSPWRGKAPKATQGVSFLIPVEAQRLLVLEAPHRLLVVGRAAGHGLAIGFELGDGARVALEGLVH